MKNSSDSAIIFLLTGKTVSFSVEGITNVPDWAKGSIRCLRGLSCDGPERRKRKTVSCVEPEGQENSRYFVPVTNPAAMNKLHPMLTREEMESLVSFARNHSASWVADENQRKQLYRELIAGGDRQRLMGTMCTLYREAPGRGSIRCSGNEYGAGKAVSADPAVIRNKR